MPAFTSEFITFVALLLGAVLYVTVLVSAFRKRSGQELTAALLGIFTLVALGFQVIDAFWRGGFISQMDARAFFEVQIFGAVLLAFLITLIALWGSVYWILLSRGMTL